MPATAAAGGRPSLPVRLMADLLYLEHAYDLSDEAVCERWMENPYWQFFACAGSGLHRQGQSASAVRIRRQGRYCSQRLQWERAVFRAIRMTGTPWSSNWSRRAGCGHPTNRGDR
ncbi:transposase [Xanthomonas fragariae LMG 25863]|nr:transposase [Xanthomonas fragariae LMG 25863]